MIFLWQSPIFLVFSLFFLYSIDLLGMKHILGILWAFFYQPKVLSRWENIGLIYCKGPIFYQLTLVYILHFIDWGDGRNWNQNLTQTYLYFWICLIEPVKNVQRNWWNVSKNWLNWYQLQYTNIYIFLELPCQPKIFQNVSNIFWKLVSAPSPDAASKLLKNYLKQY